MNTNATSNQTLRDIIVLLLGAGLATIVLLVLYFATPLGTANMKAVPEEDTPTITENVVDGSPSPSQDSQTMGLYDVDSLADILTNYSGSFDTFAALYSLVSQSDEQKLVNLFNESLTYQYSELDESWFQDSIRRTILSRLIHVNEKVASATFLSLDTDQQTSISYTFAREWARVDLDSAVNFVVSLADSVKFSGTRAILDLNKTLPTDKLTTLATRLGDTTYVRNMVELNLLEEEAENPKEAWAKLSADPNLLTEENRTRILNIVDAWLKEEGLGVLDTVTAAIEDENLKERIIRNGLRIVTEDDPAAAFDYALQFESGGWWVFWYEL